MWSFQRTDWGYSINGSCCGCFVIPLVLAFAIWGTIELANDSSANRACSGNTIVGMSIAWVVLHYVIAMFQCLTTNVRDEWERAVRWISVAWIGVEFILWIVTLVVFVKVDDDCKDEWEDEHYGLWVYFQGIFWFGVAYFSIVGLVGFFALRRYIQGNS